MLYNIPAPNFWSVSLSNSYSITSAHTCVDGHSLILSPASLEKSKNNLPSQPDAFPNLMPVIIFAWESSSENEFISLSYAVLFKPSSA